MYAEERDRLEIHARVLKAMAHPARLFIMEVLAKRERSVRELAVLIGADMSTVSRHLSVLRNAGIVDCEKRGTRVFYRLHVRCALRFFSCTEQFVISRAGRLRKTLR